MVEVIAACLLGFFMTWGVGANDLANVMSPSLGAKAFSTRTAFMLAILFEILGALFGGADVTQTMRHRIIDIDPTLFEPNVLIYGMLALLFACMGWINVASLFGLPVSITHSIVGALVGFGSIVMGLSAIHWDHVSRIALSWVVAPLFSGCASYCIFFSLQKLILGQVDPFQSAKRNLPCYFFLVGMLLTQMTVIKGLERFHLDWFWLQDLVIDMFFGSLAYFMGKIYIRHWYTENIERRSDQFKNIEQMFAVLLMLTTGAMVFAHGANDVSIAVAPISIILSLKMNAAGDLEVLPPLWITLFGLSGVILGLIFYGRRVIETVGSGITTLTPSRAFAATFSASSAVILLTSFGIPVSATQTLVGAVLGVGLARGIGALNITVIRNIFASWLITIPVVSLLTVIFYWILRQFF